MGDGDETEAAVGQRDEAVQVSHVVIPSCLESRMARLFYLEAQMIQPGQSFNTNILVLSQKLLIKTLIFVLW